MFKKQTWRDSLAKMKIQSHFILQYVHLPVLTADLLKKVPDNIG